MSFFNELKRRNVIRVGVAYVVMAWLMAQVLQLVFETFGAPDWVMKALLVLIAAGLPLVLIIAWAFELTPEGIKRDEDVDRTQSIAPRTGKKLDGLIAMALVLALGYIVVDKFVLDEPGEPGPAKAVTQVVTEPAVEAASPPGAPEQSIAVLPFVNMSDDKDYFADGLSEELLNLLAHIPGLKVAGRTSSFAFKGKNDDLRAIGDALGVANVLEGSVRRSGERLRITAQLVKVDDGFHIWSETYDRQMADIFDIQDEVATAITNALELHLSQSVTRPTKNTDAYALYLQALAINPTVIGNVENWSALIDQAIALDPEFAKAWELKATFYWLSGGWFIDNREAQSVVYQSAKTALELDPSLATARALWVSANPDLNFGMGAFEAFESLVLEEPDNYYALDAFSWYLLTRGYFKDAISVTDKMIELEPLNQESWSRRGEILSAAGRTREAELTWSRSTGLGNTDDNMYFAISSLLQDKDEVAVLGLEKWLEARDMNPADARLLVDQGRDPVMGKAVIDQWIEQAMAAQQGAFKSKMPYLLYLGFGYLDAYWAVQDSFQLGPETWSDEDFFVQAGMVFRAAGYCRHPRYLPFAVEEGYVEVWEKRGPPDHCNKADGQWRCQ